VSPAETGQPFRATLTNAAINNARAERQRTTIPPRSGTRASSGSAPVPTGSATDYSLPMPTQRPAHDVPEPGSRANWPLLNSGDEVPTAPAASAGTTPTDDRFHSDGRVKPPWQDMPKEPPALRLVEPTLETTVPDLSAINEPPPLRLVDRGPRPWSHVHPAPLQCRHRPEQHHGHEHDAHRPGSQHHAAGPGRGQRR